VWLACRDKAIVQPTKHKFLERYAPAHIPTKISAGHKNLCHLPGLAKCF
jgi:hypothetical protein